MINMQRIFLIDDDKVLNFAHEKMLRLAGFEHTVTSFTSAIPAINTIEEALATNGLLPDLVFLDLQMPGMDGWAFLDKLYEMQPGLPASMKIYMLSSVITGVEVKRAEDHSSIDGVIQKPLTLEKLKMLFSTMQSKNFFVAD